MGYLIFLFFFKSRNIKNLLIILFITKELSIIVFLNTKVESFGLFNIVFLFKLESNNIQNQMVYLFNVLHFIRYIRNILRNFRSLILVIKNMILEKIYSNTGNVNLWLYFNMNFNLLLIHFFNLWDWNLKILKFDWFG